MTRRITLTPDEIRAVLLGLGHSSNTTTVDRNRAAAIGAVCDALERDEHPAGPVVSADEAASIFQFEADLRRLRARLTEELGVPAEATVDQLGDAVAGVVESNRHVVQQRDKFRDALSALLGLPPWSADSVIVDAATARLALDAARRSADKTARLAAASATPAGPEHLGCASTGCGRVSALGSAFCCDLCSHRVHNGGDAALAGATHTTACDARQHAHAGALPDTPTEAEAARRLEQAEAVAE